MIIVCLCVVFVLLVIVILVLSLISMYVLCLVWCVVVVDSENVLLNALLSTVPIRVSFKRTIVF